MIFFKKLSFATCRSIFNRGFTVVELLVVIAVIGILYTVVMSSVGESRSKGRDSKRIADISLIQLALERYYDEYHYYPTLLSDNSLDSSMPEIDPLDNNYSYKALTGGNNATCSANTSCQSYHLGIMLELYNGILSDDADLNLNSEVSGDFNGADNTTSTFMYDVIPKF